MKASKSIVSPRRRAPVKSAAPDLAAMRESWKLSLRYANKSDNTIAVYLSALQRFEEYLSRQHLPTHIDAITRDHVQGFITELLDKRADTTAHNRFRALKTFFSYCVGEEELAHSPMERMLPPKIREKAAPVLDDDVIHALLKSMNGSGFDDRRDTAMVRVWLDTGVRRDEMASMTVDNLRLAQRKVSVLGKGGIWREVTFGTKTAMAVDRYLRARARHPFAKGRELWVGLKGPLTGSGIYQLVNRRYRQAGLEHMYPHLFRHFFSHSFLNEGGNEVDLMELNGWKSRAMVARYAKSAAHERAINAHGRLVLGDRF